MVRLDMSEFMERHTVSKLIGSPPGEALHRISVTSLTPVPRHLVSVSAQYIPRQPVSVSAQSIPRHLVSVICAVHQFAGRWNSRNLAGLLGGEQVACSNLLRSPCCGQPAAPALLAGVSSIELHTPCLPKTCCI